MKIPQHLVDEAIDAALDDEEAPAPCDCYNECDLCDCTPAWGEK